jgi:hypothetical protein
MSKTKHKYTQISGNYISHLSPLSPREYAEFKSSGLNSIGRIFVKTKDIIPAGSPLEFDLKVPKEGEYHVKGLAEWSNEGECRNKDIGFAVRLLEISTKTVATDQSGQESEGSMDTLTETNPPEDATDENSEDKKDESTSEKVGKSQKDIPMASEISEILESLFSEKIGVTEGSPVELSDNKPMAIAIFVLDDRAAGNIIIADLDITVYIGSFLAEIPRDQAKNLIDSKELPDNVIENFREVLNILAGIFNKPDSPHVSLGEVYTSISDIPDEQVAAINKPSQRSDLHISIPDFGEGEISILSL